MTREKVKHEYISDDVKRKVSFRKRKGSIMKKVRELSILCGVEAGAIVYSSPSDPQPEVWPDPEGVQQVIERYQAKPVLEKTLNQEGLIQQRIDKEKELLKKRRKENHEEEISQLMLNCMAGQTKPSTMEDAIDMKTVVEQSLKNINRMAEASCKEVEVYVPVPPTSEELLVLRENKLTEQILQFGMDTGKEVEVYVPAPPMSEGLLINVEREKLIEQNLQHGMDSDNLNNPPWWKDMGNVEDYMGVGAYEMPLLFSNSYYPYAPSSHDPFSP